MRPRLAWPVLPLVLILALPAGSAIELFRSTHDGGGGTSVGGDLSLTGTIGQPDAGTASGGTLELSGGFWSGVDPATAVEGELPVRVNRLHGAVPNPFNPATTIRFQLARIGPVTVRLYSLAGRLVRELHAGVLEPGTHELPWNGRDADGRAVASGVYLVQLRAPGFAASQKLTLVK